MSVRPPARRLPVVVAAAVLLMVPFAGVADAHVEAESEGATRGGSGTVTFTVPTEKGVPTTRFEVAFPTDTPLVDVTATASAEAAAPSAAAAPTVAAEPTAAAEPAPSGGVGDGISLAVVAVLAVVLAGAAVAAARRRSSS